MILMRQPDLEKKREVVKILTDMGCIQIRSRKGGHEWWKNPITGKAQPLPRGRKIDKYLAMKVIKELSNPE